MAEAQSQPSPGLNDDSATRSLTSRMSRWYEFKQELNEILLDELNKINKSAAGKIRAKLEKGDQIFQESEQEIARLTGERDAAFKLHKTAPMKSYAAALRSEGSSSSSSSSSSFSSPSLSQLKGAMSKTVASHVLLVYPEKDDAGMTSEKMKSKIQKKVDPVKLGVGIKKVRAIKGNGLAIECERSDDIGKLSSAISGSSKLKGLVKCREPLRRRPRVVVADVDDDFTKESLVACLGKQNDITLGEGDIKAQFDYKSKRGRSWVLECSPSAFKALMALGKVNLGWQRYVLREYLHVPHCFKCYHTGNKQQDCKSEQKCSLCAGNHSFRFSSYPF